MLDGFPRQTDVVVLLVLALQLIGLEQTRQRVYRRAAGLVEVVIISRGVLQGRPLNSVSHDRVSGVVVVGVGARAQTLDALERGTNVEVQRHPFADLPLQLTAEVVGDVARLLHDGLLVVVGVAHIIRKRLVTTRDVGVVLLLETRATEDLLLVVCTFETLVALQVAETANIGAIAVVLGVADRSGLILILKERILIGRHHLHELRGGLPTPAGVEGHLGLLAVGAFAALCRHDDNAVSTLGTVDSGRRGVLQHVDGLDFRGSNVADVAYLEAVDNVQRRVVLRQRATTTHADGRLRIGSTVGHRDVHTRQLTLQGLRHVAHGDVLDLLRAHLRHGTRQVLLTNRTVTDGYNLFQHSGVVLHLDIELGLALHVKCLGLHTDVGNLNGILS